MMNRNTVTWVILMLLVQFSWAQQKNNYYLAHDLPGHTAVKYNTFLMNPAFPIFGYKESHVALYHRQQWMNFQNNFSIFMGTYGKKWSDNEVINVMAFQKKIGVFQNTGFLGNYVHQIGLGDESYLRLGINASFGMSGIAQGKIVANDSSDPFLANFSNTGIFNINPAFDINFGMIHFGLNAENLIDYALAGGEMAVPFSDKAFTGHVMYRNTMTAGSGVLEEATLSVLARGRKSADNFQMGGHAMLDMPTLGWVHAGYDQKYGVSAGLGFNVNANLSAGFGYEQGIGTYVSNLGGTYEITLAYNFGGERQARAKKLAKDRKAKEVELENKRKAAERAKEEKKKPAVVTPTTQTTPPPPKPEEKPKTIMQRLEERLKVQEHKIANDKISEGFYVIAGVYRNPRGAYQYVQNVKALGLTVHTFVHPENSMTYVYFNKAYNSKGEAGVVMTEMLKRPEFANKSIWVLSVRR
ncbi:PorP/SprF family type IX secretion system membrane protein [Capnocytophaga sp. H2931]|uniref:PorP/SprF family type IX secretion system membrane protein n=1 Tax=Capnocytophaga sp. H2931 TaxID=1945657 RepID=UPI000BB1E85C|nr:PorP/SprF family type IX secretion system membrane protein [Capnocytophaga sp. H2931]ATA75653.1 hypothetical protein CGC52_09610 [Capnocytophaga sp. H2931]